MPPPSLTHWVRLSPDFVRKVASWLLPNDVAGSLAFVNCATAACLQAAGGYNQLPRREGQEHPIAVQPWPGHTHSWRTGAGHGTLAGAVSSQHHDGGDSWAWPLHRGHIPSPAAARARKLHPLRAAL